MYEQIWRRRRRTWPLAIVSGSILLFSCVFSAIWNICCCTFRRIMRKRVVIPYIAFILCIAVQLRILSTVPNADLEKTTCKDTKTPRHAKRNVTAPESVSPTRYLDDSKRLSVRRDWIELSRDILSMSKQNTSAVLQKGMEQFQQDSNFFGYSQNIRQILTIGIILNDETSLPEFIRTVDFIVEDNAKTDAFVVVIYLTTCSEDKNIQAGRTIYKRYPEQCALGKMRLIKAPTSLYTAHGIIDKNGCSSNEVRKRKENIDYALLFQYARNISLYYVQYESGMKCIKYIVSKVLSMISTQKNTWFAVDFGHLGFIGTLFHSSFLSDMADFLVNHNETYDTDYLLTRLFESLSEKTVLYMHSMPCSQKDMKSLRKRYRMKRRRMNNLTKGDNPPAKFLTNMEIFKNFSPSKTYDNNNDTFMWCNYVQQDNFFRLVFEAPVNISRMIVITGADDGTDILKSGILRVGTGSYAPCENLVRRGVFVEGTVDTQEQGIVKLPSNIGCVSIDVTENQSDWLVIREIRVYVGR